MTKRYDVVVLGTDNGGMGAAEVTRAAGKSVVMEHGVTAQGLAEAVYACSTFASEIKNML